MRVAQTKVDLVGISRAEWSKLMLTLECVPDDVAERLDADGQSIKDVVAHGALAIGLVLGWYADGQAGRDGPPKKYCALDLKFGPTTLRTWQEELSWPGTRRLLGFAHERLMGLVDELDDTALYGGPMKGANNNWSMGRWAEAAGAGHYRTTRRYISKRMKPLVA